MKKMDKETLLDLHITLKDLIDEVQDLLRLEAPSNVSERAKIWIEQIADALGGGNYVDTYTATFWTTLEELGIIKVDGSTANLKDDEDDELEDEDEEGTEKECPRCLVSYPLHVRKCITKKCERELGSDTIHKKPQQGMASWQTDSQPRIDRDGVKRWYNKYGQLHRSDGPAVEKDDGHKEWHQYGQPHRDGAPAIIFANGDTIWYWRGKYHREDGPAINFANGNIAWYRFGLQLRPHSDTKTSDTTKTYSRGWDRIWGGDKSSTNDKHSLLLLTAGTTKKENSNEDEDFVEVVYGVDEIKSQDQGNQEQGSGVAQEATVELKEAQFELAKETKSTSPTIPSKSLLKDIEDAKNVFPFPLFGWGEYGDWMGME